MKAIHSIIAAAVLAFVQPAQAATSDPEVIIYRFPGFRGSGVLGGSDATLFHCTNFSGMPENIRFVTRERNATLVSNVVVTIAHLETKTVGTKFALSYSVDVFLPLASIGDNQGSTAIAATSTNIGCTAMAMDANVPAPNGVSLRGIRFNPVPGSQE
jgi:hypothetical protein